MVNKGNILKWFLKIKEDIDSIASYDTFNLKINFSTA